VQLTRRVYECSYVHVFSDKRVTSFLGANFVEFSPLITLGLGFLLLCNIWHVC
jgi:hypothetical protein